MSLRNNQGNYTILGREVDAAQVMEQARIAMSLLCRFGGVGSKSRKGFGSLQWDAALPLQTCLEKAKAFCQLIGANIAETNAAYSFKTAFVEEIQVSWNDPWTVLDRLGFAAQKFAQKYKHGGEKAVLGLPRKIHGPKRDPMNHQHAGSHKQPENLLPDLQAAQNGNQTRFASPVFYHVEPAAKGSLVRIIAFPSGMIRRLDVSNIILKELVGAVRSELENFSSITAQPAATDRRSRDTRPTQNLQANRNVMTGGIKAGSKVRAKLLEEKTKKGGWKAEFNGSSGPIINSAAVPSDKLPGEIIDLIIHSANPLNPSFRWPEN